MRIRFLQIISFLGKFLQFNQIAFSTAMEVLPVTWWAIITLPKDGRGRQGVLLTDCFPFLFIRRVGRAVCVINPSQCHISLQYIQNFFLAKTHRFLHRHHFLVASNISSSMTSPLRGVCSPVNKAVIAWAECLCAQQEQRIRRWGKWGQRDWGTPPES